MATNPIYLKVYNASAGSGKTTTLIKEIIRIILSPEKLDIKKVRGILGLTFTNAVADELKKRLVEVLYNTAYDKEKFNQYKKVYFNDIKLKDEEIQNRAKNILTHILHNYSDLSLQTIDSFSNRVLKSFAYELNYPIVYEISANNEEYYDRALDDYLDNIQSLEDEKLKLILAYINDARENEGEDYRADDLFKNIKNYLKPLVEKESAIEVVEPMKEKINKIDRQKIEKIHAKYKEILEKEKAVFNHNIQKVFDKHFGVYNGDDWVEEYEPWISKNQFNFLKSFRKDPFSKYSEILGDKKIHKGGDKNKEKIDAFIKDLLIYRENFVTIKLLSDRLGLIKVLLDKILVTKFALELLTNLNKLKQEDDVVFFSDFTREISKIIQSENSVDFIFEKVGTRYRNFLIDEFQDTSTLQFHNLLPLIHNAMSEGNENFIVGDPKQSIYRWRNANVQQFVTLYKDKDISFERLKNDWEKFKENILSQSLNVNYRSAKDIVEFNNKIFNNLDFDGIKLISDVYQDASQNPHNISDGYVEVIEMEGGNQNERFEIFANEVFKRIEECIQNGYQQKDICVLFRYNKNITQFISALRGRKLSNGEEIQFISPEGLKIYWSPEVNFISSFLNLMVNRDDKLSSAICWNYVNKKDFNYDENIKQNFFNTYKENEDFKKIFSNANISKKDLYQLCLDVIQFFNIPLNISVQKFLDVVNQFAHQYALQGNTIEHFLNFWNKNKKSFTIVTGDDINAIKLMTIHKSKGLEFPVVFTYLNFDNKSSNYWYKIKDDFVIEFSDDEKINDFAGNYFYLNTKNIEMLDEDYANILKAEEHLENINLIYVALTRAMQRMYIFTGKGKNPPYNYYYQKILKNKLSNPVESQISQNEKIIVYSYGQKTNKKQVSKPSEKNVFTIDENIRLINNDNMLLADEYHKHYEATGTGIKVHKVLEFLENGNVYYAIQKAKSKGILRHEETESIQNLLNQIVQHPALSKYFQHENIQEILNENSIFTLDDEVKRPDKIIVTKDKKLVILEFKTGEANHKHKKQIKQYMETLKKAYGNFDVEGYLVYLNNENKKINVLDAGNEIKNEEN